jgi:hypothetical protein
MEAEIGMYFAGGAHGDVGVGTVRVGVTAPVRDEGLLGSGYVVSEELAWTSDEAESSDWRSNTTTTTTKSDR